MKKIVVFILLLLFISTNVNAESIDNQTSVELIKCDSVTDIWVLENAEVKRVALLAYDRDDGKLNKEIDDFFCRILGSANNINIQYDVASTDKYNRDLVYIYADGKLLQEELIRKGYGQVGNIEADYLFLDQLCEIQKQAIASNLGIWSYGDIKEKYCNSGIEITESSIKMAPISAKTSKNNNNVYKNMILLSSGIIMLLIIMKMKQGYFYE